MSGLIPQVRSAIQFLGMIFRRTTPPNALDERGYQLRRPGRRRRNEIPSVSPGDATATGLGTPHVDSELGSTLSGWHLHVHPDGSRYFAATGAPVLTPNDMNNVNIRDVVSERSTSLLQKFEPLANKMCPVMNFELWINVGEGLKSDEHIFLNHTGRQVMIVSGDPSVMMVKSGGELAYWTHLHDTPRVLPEHAELDMLSAIGHFAIERILIGDRSISPFTVEQCKQILSMHQVPDSENDTTNTMASEVRCPEACQNYNLKAWIVSLMMKQIWEVRTKCQYGIFLPKVPIVPPEFSREFKVLDAILLLCFGTHQRYRKRLKRIHENGSRHIARRILSTLTEEWKDSNLLCTVFLTSNMAFLAIPDIKLAQQAASVLSTVFSMAGIALGIHHIWRHRFKSNADLDDILGNFHSASTVSRVTLTSISLCLPLVFLLWSVISFAVALLLYSFQNYRGIPLIFMAIIVVAIIIATIWVIVIVFWDGIVEFSITWLRKASRIFHFHGTRLHAGQDVENILMGVMSSQLAEVDSGRASSSSA